MLSVGVLLVLLTSAGRDGETTDYPALVIAFVVFLVALTLWVGELFWSAKHKKTATRSAARRVPKTTTAHEVPIERTYLIKAYAD